MLALLATLPGRMGAQGLVVDPHDTVVVARGRPDDTTPWTAYVRVLRTTGDAPAALTLLSSDLTCAVPAATVSRAQVALGENVMLAKGVAANVPIRIVPPHFSGDCAGSATLSVGTSGADTVRLRIVARGLATLTPLPGTDQLRLSLIRCTNGVSCALAYWLVPAAANARERTLQLDNPARLQPDTITMTPVLSGQQAGGQVPSDGLAVGTDSLPHGTGATGPRIIRVPLVIRVERFQPDKYSGTLRLNVANHPDVIALPAEVNVRVGPMLPILMLLLGILLGYLFKLMQAREPQLRLFSAVSIRDYRLRQMRPDDRNVLTPYVQGLLDRIYEMRLDGLDAMLVELDDRLETLRLLRQIEDQLPARPDPATDHIVELLAEGRAALAAGDNAGAKAKLTEAKSALAASSSSTNPNAIAPHAAVIARAQRHADAEPESSSDDGEDRVKAKWIARVTLAWQSIEPEVLLVVVRPLLRVVLLVGLCVIGLRAFYVDNATFGAAPLGDYLALVIWGLSSDATSRTVADLGRTIVR